MVSALIMLIMPLKIFDERRKLQTMLEQEARLVSRAAYIGSISGGLVNESAQTELEGYTEELLRASAVKLAIKEKVNRDIFENISFGRDTAILQGDEDNAMIRVYMEYDVRPPVNFLGIKRLAMSSVVNRRAFVGSRGGRGRDKYMLDNEGTYPEDGDRIVYVGRTRTRYHSSRSCHYISNDYKTAAADAIAELRNKDGRPYKPCETCRPDGSGRVYYFENGTSYHGSRDCRAIGAYVEAVRLSEVVHLGACSYCGK